jgi:predicted transcriptional regulator of viral defense system
MIQNAHMKAKADYRKLYSIAEPQAGYFTVKQVQAANYTRQDVYYQAKRKEFVRVGQGVYRITLFPSSPFEDLFIALLKSGPKAVLSHETALSVYNLSDALPGELHITLPRTSSRRNKGIRYHTKTISDREITRYQGLRVTTVPRTIIDLMEAGFDSIQVEKAIHQALQRGMMTEADLTHQAGRKSASLQEKVDLFMKKRAP